MLQFKYVGQASYYHNCYINSFKPIKQSIFLFKDQGAGKRSVYSLGIRVSLAVMLLILVTYGLYTGELGNSVPWES